MKTRSSNGQFKPLSLNERIRRAYVKNPSIKDVAKSMNVRYQRIRNVVKSMKLSIVRYEDFQQNLVSK